MFRWLDFTTNKRTVARLRAGLVVMLLVNTLHCVSPEASESGQSSAISLIALAENPSDRFQPHLVDLVVDGEPIRLQLEEYSLFSEDHMTWSTGERDDDDNPVKTYSGVIEDTPGSWARISIFNGDIHGTISTGDSMYSVERSEESSWELVVQHSDDPDSFPFECGTESSDRNLRSARTGTESPSDDHYQVEIIVIADHRFIGWWGDDNRPFTSKMYHTLNIADAIMERDLGLSLTISKTVLFSRDDPEENPFVDLPDTGVHTILHAFRPLWSEQMSFVSLDDGDAALILSTFNEGNVSGVASLTGGVCDEVHAVAVTSMGQYGWPGNWQLIAHELGHLFGADHDTTRDGMVHSRCPADTPTDRIMTGQGIQFLSPQSFSDCSRSAIRNHLVVSECVDTVAPSVLCGDANRDQEINTTDALTVLRWVAAGQYDRRVDILVPGDRSPLTPHLRKLGARDALAIVRVALGLDTEPLQCVETLNLN